MNKEDFRDEVARRIKQCRAESGLTQAAAAARAGIQATHLSHFETGRRLPGLYNLAHLARAIGVPVGALIPAPGKEGEE